MARKTEEVTITAEGRDKAKVFLLTEMPATQGENWANRLILAVGSQGQNTNMSPIGGMAGIYTLLASIGVQSFLKMEWSRAEPLLREMFTCIKLIPDPARPEISRPLLDDDIEEITTRWHLRERVLSLHMGFSLADMTLTFLRSMSAQMLTTPSTPTSPSPSDGSSAADLPPSTS